MTLRTTVVGFACTLLAAAAGCNGSNVGGERRLGPESVVIALPGALERPAVEFDHGKHVKALEQKCDTCHPEAKPGRLSLKFVSLQGGDGRDAMIDGYHARCGTCHGKRARQMQAPGPLMCGDCHVKGAAAVSPSREVAFAGQLHELHLQIVENDCTVCHHHGSPGTTAPPPCKDCHGGAAVDGQPGLREAYHLRCVGCHHENGLDEGCGFCHDRAAK